MANSRFPHGDDGLAALFAGAKVIAVATSGGCDSAAALLRVGDFAPAADIVACYVDHGMRPRASIRRDIAAVCAQADVAAARVLVARIHGMRAGAHSEGDLRRARYVALRAMARRVRATVVVTGHHAGDVAEWVLLALLRGSGLDGLRPMAVRSQLSDGVTLVRPFLGETRERMAAIAIRSGVTISVDETNADEKYRRNMVRAFLARWPSRAQGGVRALVRSAALAAEEIALLDAIVSSLATRARRSHDTLDLHALRDEPTPLVRRIVRDVVRAAARSTTDFSFAQCDAIARAIGQRRGGEFRAGKFANVSLSAGLLVVRSTRRRSNQADHKGPPLQFVVNVRAESVPRGARISVRWPRSGDKCTPSGRRRPVSLARFLAKQGVPRDRRANVPLLCVDESIAAAIGVRVMEPYAVQSGDKTLKIAWRPSNLSAPPGPADSITMEHSAT